MWYDSKLTKYDISALPLGEGSVEDYQYLVGSTHFDYEDASFYQSGLGPICKGNLLEGGLTGVKK